MIIIGNNNEVQCFLSFLDLEGKAGISFNSVRLFFVFSWPEELPEALEEPGRFSALKWLERSS